MIGALLLLPALPVSLINPAKNGRQACEQTDPLMPARQSFEWLRCDCLSGIAATCRDQVGSKSRLIRRFLYHCGDYKK